MKLAVLADSPAMDGPMVCGPYTSEVDANTAADALVCLGYRVAVLPMVWDLSDVQHAPIWADAA